METRKPVEIYVYLLRDSPARRDDFTSDWEHIISIEVLWYKMARRCTCGRECCRYEPHFQICYDNNSKSKEQSPEDKVIQQYYAAYTGCTLLNGLPIQ